MSVLSIRDASFTYDKKRNIFEHLTCEIEDNQIFCILGPNGIGKSTLLKGLMNLYALAEGEILLDGKRIGSYAPKDLARYMAYIPQTYQLTFPYRVIDLILMGRTPHLNTMNRPSEEDYEKAEEAIRQLSLQDIVYSPCNQLSGGQLQMVMLARALAQEARFLLLDEPTSHLDFGRQMDTLRLIRSMKEKGVGVIMTTHNPDHTFIAGDKVAIMNRKTFTAVGTPEEVVTEENLKEAYGVEVMITEAVTRTGKRIRSCVPVL